MTILQTLIVLGVANPELKVKVVAAGNNSIGVALSVSCSNYVYVGVCSRMQPLEITGRDILRKIKAAVKAEPFKSPGEVYEEIFPEELDKLDANTRSLIVHMFPTKTGLYQSLYRFNL